MSNISTILQRAGRPSGAGVASAVRCLAAVTVVVAGLSFSACGNESSTRKGSDLLRTALTADPAPLDPDTYYEAEGLAITTSVYEGLLRYEKDSPKIIGALAESWEVTDGSRTFTFKLLDGVKFSDGTPFDSAAAKASFQRRIDLEGGPSYMLADVQSMDTPDPSTFVVRLRKPSQVFLDYLASPYGPLMTSPTAVKEHAVGDDHASKWFGSHSAGTGPYQLSTVKRGSLYQLTANPHYHGSKPHFKTVNFNVVPSMETQRLQVQGGQQDLVLQRLPYRDLVSLKEEGKVQVLPIKTLFKAGLWINPKSPVFGPAGVRAALRAYLDNETITKELYGDFGTTSTDVYPAGMLPEGAAPDVPEHDPDQLAPALAPYKGRKVTVGYYSSLSQNRELASRLQTQLESLGLKATVREYPPSILFSLPEEPNQRPDILATAFNPDAVAPDTFARIYWYKDAPVNLLGCTDPEGDRLLDEAASATTQEAGLKANVAAAEAYRKSNCWLNIADANDVYVARKGLTGFEKELAWTLAVRLGALKED
jgi:peptide/nickel transport system substrate-binding protein